MIGGVIGEIEEGKRKGRSVGCGSEHLDGVRSREARSAAEIAAAMELCLRGSAPGRKEEDSKCRRAGGLG